jgi:hypothetical protein
MKLDRIDMSAKAVTHRWRRGGGLVRVCPALAGPRHRPVLKRPQTSGKLKNKKTRVII